MGWYFKSASGSGLPYVAKFVLIRPFLLGLRLLFPLMLWPMSAQRRDRE